MSQPVFALSCTYGLTARRGNRIKRIQFGDGYEQVSPDGINRDMRSYSIETAPISDETAIELDRQLTALQGDFFYSQFFMDDQPYKYRLENNSWEWRTIGPDSNIFSFNVKRIYDPRA